MITITVKESELQDFIGFCQSHVGFTCNSYKYERLLKNVAKASNPLQHLARLMDSGVLSRENIRNFFHNIRQNNDGDSSGCYCYCDEDNCDCAESENGPIIDIENMFPSIWQFFALVGITHDGYEIGEYDYIRDASGNGCLTTILKNLEYVIE